MPALALALVLAAIATVTAGAAATPERPVPAPRAALVSNGPDQVKSELGSYCVTTTGGESVGMCADAFPPAKPPTPRLGVSPAGRVEVRFRHVRGLADEVTRFSASLARVDGEHGFKPIDPAIEPRRVEGTKRRWEFRLPQELRGANVMVLFARLERGDASFFVGLRQDGGQASPTICPATGGNAFDTAELVGHSVSEAEALAEQYGCTVRIGELDGEPLPGTADYRTNRVNVAVGGDRVERILGVG